MKIKQILLFTMCLGFSKFPSADGNLWAQNFTGSYSMHIEDSATKKSVDLKITFKKEKSCLEIITGENEGKFKTIFDEHEKTMTILTDKEGGSKMAMILNMPDKVESSEQITSNANITITDETKIIENYSCKKIIVESADAVTEMWMTEDLRITYTDMLTMLNRGGGPISGMIPKLKNY